VKHAGALYCVGYNLCPTIQQMVLEGLGTGHAYMCLDLLNAEDIDVEHNRHNVPEHKVCQFV
jgi:hypothetical protein